MKILSARDTAECKRVVDCFLDTKPLSTEADGTRVYVRSYEYSYECGQFNLYYSTYEVKQ